MSSPKLFRQPPTPISSAPRDVEFRQKLLTESLDILLDELQRRRRLHATPATSAKVQSSPSAWPK
jgi:hypothetical protein